MTRRARSFLQAENQPRFFFFFFFFSSAPESKPGSGLQFLVLFFFTVSLKNISQDGSHSSGHDFYLFVRMELNLKHDCLTDRCP